ncbi:MAG: hypothetical protein CXT73_05420 [Methanobacteriota archaeon]|jgi:hypothetical protein|nr:MAG: hypothetical protein CXT73_05420 [Euryarchaeota archaeon]
MSTPINKKLSCLGAVKRRKDNHARPAIPSIAIIQSTRDRSGSMASFQGSAAQSLYTSIIDHKQNSKDNNVKITYSLTTFDDKVDHPFQNVDIHDVDLSEEDAHNLVAPRGLTRLYATAIEDLARLRKTVKKIKSENPNATVKGIFELHTDGHDNESKPLTSTDLNAAVTAARTEDIVCIYAGANQDAITTGTSYGFSADLSLTTDSTPTRGGTGLRMCSQAVMRACSGNAPQFTQSERNASAPTPSFDQTLSSSPSTMAAGAALLAMRGPPRPARNILTRPGFQYHNYQNTTPPPLTRQTNQRIV